MLTNLFFLYYPEDSHVIAPVGSKRVGSTIKTDEKKGCTVMGAMGMFSSTLLPPFIVLEGAHFGLLHKQWVAYNRSFVTFQPKHWFDKIIMTQFIDFVYALYPEEKVGIILDRSSIHTSPEIVDYMETLGFVVEFIHAGMTSIEQPCDIYLNRTAKGIVRDQYYRYKGSLNLPAGSKCPVTSEHLVQWVEFAFEKVQKDQATTRKIAYTFRKCGMDPFTLITHSLCNHAGSNFRM